MLKPSRLLALISFLSFVVLGSAVALTQSLELKPGYISGTVTVQAEAISQLNVYAYSGSQSASFNQSNTNTYALTVNVPAGTTPVYTVQPTAYFDGGTEYLQFPSKTVTVNANAISTLDFAVVPAYVEGTITVQGGTLSYAYIYTDNYTPAVGTTSWSRGYTNSSRGSQFRFPVYPGNVRAYVDVGFTNGTSISVPYQSLGTAAAGQTVPFNLSVTAPAANGSIQGVLSVLGPRPTMWRYISASGPVYRSTTPDATTGAYTLSQLPAGSYYTYAQMYFNNWATYFQAPYGHAATGNPAIAVNGNTVTRDLEIKEAFIQGVFALTGTRTLAHSNGASVYVSGQSGTQTQGGYGQAQVSRPSGSYELVVTPGTWLQNSSNYVGFYDNTPGRYLQGSLYIYDYQAASTPIEAREADVTVHNLTYETGTVTVVLRSAGVTFRSPRVDVSCSEVVGGQARTSTWGTFYGNQVDVNVAPVTFVGIRGQCTVRTYGIVTGGSGETFFGQVPVGVVPNSDIVVDVGGPTLAVTAPAANSAFTAGPINVTGTATDDEQVASVTVNGTSATLTPTNNPNDPKEVSFSVSLPIVNGANPITVVATDNTGKSAADNRTVYLDSQDPVLTWLPADGTTYAVPGPVTISGTATDNLGISSITVNGALVYANTGTPQTSVNFSRNQSYSGGTHQLTVVVKDLGNRTISETRSIVVNAPASQTVVTTTPNPSVYGQPITATATVSPDGTSAGTPTGTVQFFVNDVSAGTGFMSNGTASITLPTQTVGTKTITAKYSGSFTYLSSTGTATHVVNKIGTTTTVTSGQNPSTYPAAVSFSATVTNIAPGAVNPGGSVQFKRNGVNEGAPVGLFNGVASRTFAALNAGETTVEAVYLGTATHESSSGSFVQTVQQGTPPLTWATPAAITYGMALGAQLNASSSLAGTFVYAPAAGTVLPAGGHSLTVTFTPTNSNYAPRTASVTLNVLKATPQVTTSGGTFTYDGSPHPSVGTATVPGAFTYSYAPGGEAPPVDASPTPYQVTAVFTPADSGNYNTVTVTNTITINKAAPVVSWANPAAIGYGTALTEAQLNASSLVPGTFAYSPAAGSVLGAGQGQPLTVNFVPADPGNYHTATRTVYINVLKATPALAWDTPADIVHGTVLGPTQLNATAPIGGTFTYTPAAGTKLNAGANQTLSVSFAPADQSNYNTASATVHINVLRATPVVTWNQPSGIVYGTLLGATQLNATADVPGAFVYTPAAGMKLNAGDDQTLSVTFTPQDQVNYTPATRTVTIDVAKAVPSIQWNTPADIVYGTLLGAAQLNATSSVGGAFTYSPAAGTKLNAGAGQTLSVTFAPSDTSNYNNAAAAVLLTVGKAPSSITVVGGTFLFDGNPHAAAGQVNGVDGVIGVPIITYDPGSTAPVNPGKYKVLASFGGDANHLPSSNDLAGIVINAMPSIVSVSGPVGPLALNTQAQVSVSFDDAATGDAHTCTFTWDDGLPASTVTAAPGAGTCSATRAYTAPGVYTVGVTVKDDDELSAEGAFKYVVVYDPNAGFVTGGGWILSPAGAYSPDLDLTGKAHFGFVSKYKKGMTVPTGTTEFEFVVGNLKFVSAEYEWLVVSGPRSQFKGVGSINGTGRFGFLLTAEDGDVRGGGGVDRFRIKIWDVTTGSIVYDNLLGADDDLAVDPQVLGGGSIVIHAK